MMRRLRSATDHPGGAEGPSPRFVGLIVAAGQGRRFGGEKQFALLAGQPVLAFSLRIFQDCAQIDRFVVVTTDAGQAVVADLKNRLNLTKLAGVMTGGDQRADSVRAGLAALPGRGRVAVHDGVRPFLTSALLARVLDAARHAPAVVCGVPVSDTVKLVADGRVIRTVDRDGLWFIQTPQCFDLDLLRRALAQPGSPGATDDAVLVEALGVPVTVVEGSTDNIKITTPADLARAERLLAGRVVESL